MRLSCTILSRLVTTLDDFPRQALIAQEHHHLTQICLHAGPVLFQFCHGSTHYFNGDASRVAAPTFYWACQRLSKQFGRQEIAGQKKRAPEGARLNLLETGIKPAFD
jgi:hypothetical protein